MLEEKRLLAMARAERSAANAKNATDAGASTAATLNHAAASDADALAELNERAEELQGCGKHLDLYTRHLMRKALSHTITPKLLDALKERPTRVHLIADYKAKPLPSGHRETQTAAFGKKGLSLHGVTALRWDGRSGDFAVLNVRVTCDDSDQTWFHTLSVLRTSMDQLTDVWKTSSGAASLASPPPPSSLPYLDEVTMQTDGANNYDCTAFMSSVQDVFTAVGLRLVRHVITEVGDGKNLCDQDFQGAQQDMNHARAGGMNLLNAQNILDALNTGKALGVVNVGMDLGARSAEPKKNPTALKGIDALYDREYEYDADGIFLGIRVRQFFGLGAGRFVTKAELQKLWKVNFDASVIQPTIMEPSGGAQPAEPRLKLSHEHSLEKFSQQRARDNARQQRRTAGSLAAYAAELQRLQQTTTSLCRYTELGCRHRPFLTLSGANAHAARCPFIPARAPDARKASVSVRVKAGGAVRLMLVGSGRVGPHGHGKVTALLSLIGQGGAAAARVMLRTVRPRLGPAYGLQTHKAVHQLSTAEARRDAAATQGQAVGVRLGVEAGSRHVSLALTVRGLVRDPPEVRVRGWAIRPPPSVERYSPERVAYLTELYDWPDGRQNEHQAFELFKKKFNADDGAYARSQRLTRAQIKAWFGSEKARRKKAGAAAALREALPDDPGEGGGAKSKTTQKQVQKGGGSGSGGAASSAVSGGGGTRRRAAALESSSESSSEEEHSEDEPKEDPKGGGGDLYGVEDVLEVRQAATGGREFLIKWERYEGPATWEPEANLTPSLVHEFLESQAAEETVDLEEAPAAAPAAPPPPHAKAKGGKKATSGKRPAAEPPAPAQPKRAAALPPRVPVQAELLVVGSAMEVQGCSEDCDLSCTVCEWEACTIVADHGATCDVCITSDQDLCKGVQRRHLRPVARAVGKRAAAAAEREAQPKQARASHVAAPSRTRKRKASGGH